MYTTFEHLVQVLMKHVQQVCKGAVIIPDLQMVKLKLTEAR